MEEKSKLLKNGFILRPEKDLIPEYKISPFSTNDISRNKALADSNMVDEYFYDRFKHQRFRYTINGRSGIKQALQRFNLAANDCVTIFTTSGNLYISSCVTKEIEKICKWSRNIEENTKILFVNHEFGYPYESLRQLANLGFPIIEDCAHSFFSRDREDLVGRVGDYVIYSFPKIFPIQIGGLLVSNVKQSWDIGEIDKNINTIEIRYLKKVISYHLAKAEEIIRARLKNYYKLRNLFLPLGIYERFPLKDGIVPGVFLFKISMDSCLLSKLKEYLYLHGIQCSVFYGENAFFIPVHQRLVNDDLNYFYCVIKSFVEAHTEASK